MSINQIIKMEHTEGDVDENIPEEKITKEQRDYMIEQNTKKMMEYIETYNYLVIDPNKNIKLYKSLRDLAKDLHVSASGISKKLKLSNYCTIVPKKTTTVYYIHDIAS